MLGEFGSITPETDEVPRTKLWNEAIKTRSTVREFVRKRLARNYLCTVHLLWYSPHSTSFLSMKVGDSILARTCRDS